MEPGLMLKTAVILLAITAVGGAVMALIRFTRKQNPPAWLAMVHGLLAGAGLTLLIYAAVTAGVGGTATAALALLLIAAAGGVVMNLAYQLKDRPLPKGLLIVHLVLAGAGFALLAYAAFG